jgi:hypothetical protein
VTTPTPPKKRRWRRWLWRLALAAIVARLLLALFLPQVLALAARWWGLSLTMRTASLSITGLSLRLEDLVVGDAARPDAPPLLTAHEFEVDASFRDLLAGDLVLVDGALVSARIRLEREPDGSWRLPAAFVAKAPVAAPPPRTAPAPAATAAAPPPFTLPARIVSARLHDVMVRIVDATGVAPREHEVTIDADVRDLGDERPGSIVVRAYSPEWFDCAWLRAEVTAQRSLLQVDWRCELQGVQPARHELPADVRALCTNMRTLGATVRGSLTGRIDASGKRREFSGNVRLAVECDDDERMQWLFAFGPTREDGTNATIPFAVEGSARDCVQSVQVRDAQIVIANDEATVHGHFAVERATLARLRPLLDARGIAMPESGVGVQATFDATVGASLGAGLRDVVVQGAGDSVRLSALQVSDVRLADGGLAIGAIAANGPELQIVRTADGALRVAGVCVMPLPAAAAARTATPPATAAAPTLPRLRLGSLDCTGVQITVRDERRPDAPPLRLDEVAVRGDGITLGADAPPGHLAANLRVVDSIESLHVDATLTPTATSLAVQAQITGSGITGKSAAPWLKPLGLAPVLKDGSLACTATAKVATNGGGIAFDAQLADVQLQDGGEKLFAVARVSGSGARLGASEIDVGDWHIEAPFVAVHRCAGGHVRAFGIEVDPDQALAAAPPPPPSPRATHTPAPVAPAIPAPPALALRLGDLGVRGAVVRLTTDEDEPVDVVVDVAVHGAGNADPVPFELRTHIAGACDRAELRGTFARAARRIEAAIDVVGLHGEGLQRLLPSRVRCTLADGAVGGHLLAALPPNTTPGALLELDALRMLDRGDEIAALDHLRLEVEEPAPDHARVVAIDGHGMRAEVALATDGLQVPGFVLAPPEPAAPRAAASPAGALRIPVLAVDALTLTCDRLVVRDRRAGDAEPLVIAGQLTMDPWQALDDAESSPPAHLHVRASLQPLCGELQVDAEIDPYAQQPTIDVTMRAAHLDFTALQRVSPRLGETVQGTVSTAEIAATLAARIDLKRHDGREFDFSHPLAGDLLIDHVSFVDTSTGTPLASVGAIEVAVRAIDPRQGDVLLRSVEISDPHIEIAREADGLHAAGLRVSIPATVGGGAPPAAGGPEFAVDRLHVEGLHVTCRDATTTPPTLLPVADGEVDLSRFSTRCFTEARPFVFNVSLRGGDVPFQKRVVHSSVFMGVLGSAAAAVTGDTKEQIEQRPLFDEFNLTGSLQPAPFLRGRMLVNAVAFELTALRGLAKQSGVDISDGLLDYHVEVDLNGPDGVHASGNNVFTWLSVSEPPGGPISTYLRLPAPVESVMWLLRNDADEQRLPFDFVVPTAGIGGGAVRDKAAEALARLIGDAVSGAAVRTASVFTGVLGLTGAVHKPISAAVPFAAGDPLPGDCDLSAVIAAVAGDEQIEVVLTHELGAADFAHAEALATPPREQVVAQAEHLRQRRSAITGARPALAAAVDALYAAGRMQEAQVRRAELVAQDELFDEVQHTLERVIEMLANDSPRAAQRRTHAAVVQLGTARLATVQAALRRALPPAAADRVVVRPARAVTTAELTGGGHVVACTRRRVVR